MKNKYILQIILAFAFAAVSVFALHAQAPQLMNYQTVVRDNNGNPEADSTPVALRFIIHDSTETGLPLFTEVHNTVTNKLGLVTVQIGSISSLAVLNWGEAPKYLEVDASINNAGYQSMGTTQLISVPYALFAGNSAVAPAGPTGPQGATGAAGAMGATGPTGAGASQDVWGLSGNTGVTAANSIGTLNNQDLRFVVNSHFAGAIDIINNQTFLGYRSGARSVGTYNAAFGAFALDSNSTGDFNTGIGGGALFANTTGSFNTGSGTQALYANTTGAYNESDGYQALTTNATGSYNTANGYAALLFSYNGYFNTATGAQSLSSNTSGSYNTGDGVYALLTPTTASYNTGLGYAANVSEPNSSNSTVLGYAATTYVDNTIVLGNPSVVSLQCNTQTISALSDIRFKKNVSDETHGLDFIMQLKPITYNLDIRKLNDFTYGKKADTLFNGAFWDKSIAYKEHILYSGFSAQQVEQAAQQAGYDFSGLVKPADEHCTYGLSYGDFVVPLVKGMQEQQKMIEEQQKTITAQQTINAGLQQQIDVMKKEIEEMKGK